MDTVQISSFMSKVDTSGECWEWTAATNENGYGRAYNPATMRTTYAHRLSYETFYGVTPKEVMHSCDNRRCVNPAHLSDGTHELNCRDMAAKGRGNTAKVTPDTARDIRKNFVPGRGGNSKYFQDLYGISRHTVRQIANGETWKDLASV